MIAISGEILSDPQALAERVAAWLLQLANDKAGPFRLCLSGGSTPKALYERLAQSPYREAFPWSRTELFWGDERFVPADDPLSNARMARQALIDHVALPASHIHAMPTEGMEPGAAAKLYERMLKTIYGADRLDPARPLFDVTLLGLGEDGHTASLFPGTEVLAERERWALPVVGAKAEARITLTYPALDSSRHVAFLVAGEGKRAMLAWLHAGDQALPAARVQPVGEAWIFADAAAEGRS